ncbi:alpha/beta fold hydrolase [Streptomyces sp. NBC_00091]|uniref:alpha/beta fold hydrolase n=1 Tax=Streptomyces sp. NBC_00091 TaxID=2975648 RepID=UPI002254D390|nr:alpha/beta hydrolase [Streptomyces sp. NBC_00091]MCX5376646.1 alpha/beta hydrolase [Streptomyces sp. NBC_00091]
MLGVIAATATATATAALAAPAVGLFAHRAVRRAANARLMRIETPGGIDEQGFVRIGGIEQWISVRGEDRANPVLLEIHGGPGAANSPYGARTRSWERHFTLVRWDMRGAGLTFAHGGREGQGADGGGIGFERLYADALEVTHHIRERLGVERVVLMPSSFGTVFGLRLARSHPELYSAYVGTDQNVQEAGRDTSAYDATLERLRAAGKAKDVARVEAMGPDPRRWSPAQRSSYDKLCAGSDPLTLETVKKVVLGSMWLSPLYSLKHIAAYFKAQAFSESVTTGTGRFDDWADGTHFQVPFFVFQGAEDVITPAARAKAYFDAVEAPVKAFALIEGASHFASFRDPERFLELLLTHVRPALAPDRPVTA